jgi:hypothetical protein
MEGGGFILVGNLSKAYFPSFSRVWNSSDRNPKGQTWTALLLGLPEVPARVRAESSSLSRQFWLVCEPNVPTTEHLFGGITPSSGPQIGRSIYVFWSARREECNGEVRSCIWESWLSRLSRLRESAKPTLAGLAPEMSFSLPKHQMWWSEHALWPPWWHKLDDNVHYTLWTILGVNRM